MPKPPAVTTPTPPPYVAISAVVKFPLIQGLNARESKRIIVASILATEQDVKDIDYQVEGENLTSKIIIT